MDGLLFPYLTGGAGVGRVTEHFGAVILPGCSSRTFTSARRSTRDAGPVEGAEPEWRACRGYVDVLSFSVQDPLAAVPGRASAGRAGAGRTFDTADFSSGIEKRVA